MDRKDMTRLLLLCVVISIALAGFAIVRAGAQGNADYDEITVHRIRVVEPDGTLRMVISNHEGLPRDSRGNRQGQNQRPGAGILFYNDEGIENGGLIFGGHRDGEGKIVNSGVSLSFDKYGVGGQMVQLAGVATARIGSPDCGSGTRPSGARTITASGLAIPTMELRRLP